MRGSQRKAVIMLIVFWILLFGAIAGVFLYYAAELFIAVGNSAGTVGWIIGIGVFLYLIAYSIAMQP